MEMLKPKIEVKPEEEVIVVRPIGNEHFQGILKTFKDSLGIDNISSED